MANTRSAAKRARQTSGRTARNKSILTGIRSQQKRFAAAVAAKDKTKAEAASVILTSRLDKAAKRGVVHANLVNRRKKQAVKALRAIA